MNRSFRAILRTDELEPRLTPAGFTLRALDHQTSWDDPRSWDDDPAATAVPGPDDSVFVYAGSYSLDLGGREVVVRHFSTQDTEALSISGGTLRVTSSAEFGQLFTTNSLFLHLASAGIVTGAGAAAPGTVASAGGYLEMENVRLQPGLVTVAGQAVFSGVTADTVTVAPTGRLRLTGGYLETLANHGQVDGQKFTADEVRNDGTLRADGFTVGAGLINHGTLGLQVLTDGYGRATHASYPYPAVAADFTTGPDGTVQIGGVDFRGVTDPLLRVTGRATLDGTLSVEGLAVADKANPQAAAFITQSNLTGRFREIVTPPTTRNPGSTGQSFLFSDKIVGLDYEADRVSLSVINNPVGLDRRPLNMGSSNYYVADGNFPPGVPAGTVIGTPPTTATGLVFYFGGMSGQIDDRINNFISPASGVGVTVDGGWDVMTIDWTAFTQEDFGVINTRRWEYANNGYDMGRSLASWLRNQGFPYTQFHVIGYSMGSWAADGFADGLSELGIAGAGRPSPLQLTLLDSYVPQIAALKLTGHDKLAAEELGDTATFAEQYYDTRDPHPPTWDGLSTETVLPNAFNINVEGTNNGLLTVNTYGPFSTINPWEWYGHQYVPDWYADTISSPLLPASLTTTPGGYWGHVRAPEFSGVFPDHAIWPRGDDYHLALRKSSAIPSVTAVAPGQGASGRVVVTGTDGKTLYELTPFGADFTGGVRVAMADVTGDGEPDVVAGTGPGAPTRVVVIDGKTQGVLFDLAPFESAFTGGVYVAAGDLTGDGIADLAISPDEGGGPRVRVFSGNGFGQIADFFGIDDPAFRGGARVAAGDLNGDGVADLVVAAGFGGGPRVAAFDGHLLATGPVRVFADFLAFEPELRNGTFVAVGDVNGDGKGDLIAGGGPGGGPRVTVFDGTDLLTNVQTRASDFFAGDVANRGGVRVTVKDLDGDGLADLVTGAGAGAGSRVTAYTGASLVHGGPPEAFALDAFPGLAAGVFVG